MIHRGGNAWRHGFLRSPLKTPGIALTPGLDRLALARSAFDDAAPAWSRGRWEFEAAALGAPGSRWRRPTCPRRGGRYSTLRSPVSCDITPASKGRRSPRNRQRGVAAPSVRSRSQRHGGGADALDRMRTRYRRAGVEAGHRHIVADRNRRVGPACGLPLGLCQRSERKHRARTWVGD